MNARQRQALTLYLVLGEVLRGVWQEIRHPQEKRGFVGWLFLVVMLPGLFARALSVAVTVATAPDRSRLTPYSRCLLTRIDQRIEQRWR